MQTKCKCYEVSLEATAHPLTSNPTAAIIEHRKVNKLSLGIVLARLPLVCFVYLSCFLKHSKESG